MTEVKMRVGNVIFSNLGPMRGQYVFFTTQSIFCMFFFSFQYYDFLVIQPHIIEIIMLSGQVETLTKTRMQVGSVTSPTSRNLYVFYQSFL